MRIYPKLVGPWLRYASMLLFFVVLSSSAGFGQTLTVTPAQSSVTLHPGDTAVALQVNVSGSGITGPVLVTLTGLPSGITVAPLTTLVGDSGTLQISASPSADTEAFTPDAYGLTSATAAVTVEALSGTTTATAPLSLTISLSNPSFMPAQSARTLPIVSINTGGVPIVSKDNNIPGSVSITSADGTVQYLPGLAGTDNTGTFKLHGNSTASWQKFPYKINLNTSTDLLNAMGLSCGYVTSGGKATCDKSSNYILLSNYIDKPMLRDWAASALALAIPQGAPYLSIPAGSPTPSGTSALTWWAPHSVFVELYLNGEYEGVYQLIEEVGIDSHKINIRKMAQTDTSGKTLTGGYLVEIDQQGGLAGYDYSWTVSPSGTPPPQADPNSVYLGLEAPDFTPETTAQTTYITQYTAAAERALYSSTYTDPKAGWRAYFDQTSLVDFYLVQDLMGNTDGAQFDGSDYFYKDESNSLLYMGPVWDFDKSAGDAFFDPGQNPTSPIMATHAPWYARLMTDASFKAAVAQQFNALKSNGIFASWIASIQAQANMLETAQVSNYARWPYLAERVYPEPYAYGSYDNEVNAFINWLNLRIGAMDAFLNTKQATTTVLTPPTRQLGIGQPLSFKAQVSGGSSPSGVITLLQNQSVLGARDQFVMGAATVASDGTTTLTVSNLPAGTYTLQAVYNGDQTNGFSASTPVTVTVQPTLVVTATNLTVDNSTPQSGQSINLTADVVSLGGAAIPTGTVTFSTASGTLGSAVLSSAGTATLSATLPLGTSLVTAYYSGDSTDGTSASNSLSFAVQDQSTVALTPSTQTITWGSPASFTTTVSGVAGTEIPTGSVALSIDGATGPTASLTSGATTFSVAALIPGQHTIVATYSGDTLVKLSTSSGNTLVTVIGPKPVGYIDKALDSAGRTSVVSQTSSLLVSGWGASYYDNGPATKIQVLVDGALFGNATLGLARGDVAAGNNNPAWTNVGYTFTGSAAGLSIGAHVVTLAVIDSVGTTTISAPANITVTSGQAATKPVAYIDQAVDAASQTSTVSQSSSLLVSGWAGSYYDNGPAKSIQILVDGVAFGTPTMGIARSDVAASHGASWLNVGYAFTGSAAGLSTGTHSVTILATDSLGGTATSATVNITVTSNRPAVKPVGYIDKAVDAVGRTSSVSQASSLLVSGWGASYYDNAPATKIQVLVDGAVFGTATLGLARGDVAAGNNNPAWINVGYTCTGSAEGLSLGAHVVTVAVTDSLATTISAPASITVTASPVASKPVAYIDKAVDASGNTSTVSQSNPLLVTGWAASYYDNGPATSVQVLVDGAVFGTATLGLPRGDVATGNNNPAWMNVGYTFTGSAAGLSVGTHPVTVRATDSVGDTIVSAPFTVTVTAAKVAAKPVGYIDKALDSAGRTSVVSQTSSLLVSGWGASYYDNGPATKIQVLVDGALFGNATLGLARGDVAAGNNNPAWTNVGYTFTGSAAGLSIGAHVVTLAVIDSVGTTTISAPANITVTSGQAATKPVAYIDQAVDAASQTSTVSQSSSLLVSGWAGSYYDNGPAKSIQILVDGVAFGTPTMGIARSDVAASHGASWLNVGYAFTGSAAGLSTGTHSVTILATDSLGGTATSATVNITVTSN